MQTDEGAITIALGKLRSRIERKTHGRGMRWNQNIRYDRARDQIGPLALMFGIVVASDIRIRPAVESAVFDGGNIVRNQIVTERVPLVDRGPYGICTRIKRQPNRISQASGESPVPRSVRIVFIDGGADRIFTVALIGQRSHGNIHLLSITAEKNGAGAVAARGKIYKLFRSSLSLSIAILIFIANDAVGFAEIQVPVVNCHSKDAGQALRVCTAHVGNAVIIRVAKNDHRTGSRLGNEQIP